MADSGFVPGGRFWVCARLQILGLCQIADSGFVPDGRFWVSARLGDDTSGIDTGMAMDRYWQVSAGICKQLWRGMAHPDGQDGGMAILDGV
jgi:hypothetical protein